MHEQHLLNYKIDSILSNFIKQDEAERLYKKCQRYDLLNQFYQASGRWGKVRTSIVSVLLINEW